MTKTNGVNVQQIVKELESFKQQSVKLESSIDQFTEALQLIADGKMDGKTVVATAKNVVAQNAQEVRRPGRPRKDSNSNVAVIEKRSPGRPRKTTEASVITTEKRGPGRPKKIVVTISEQVAKRGPGRPRKNNVEESTVVATMNKRGPGRPLKSATSQTTPVATGTRGRPSTKNLINEPLSNDMQFELQRIEKGLSKYNKWVNESTKERQIWKIENASYLAVIEGFYSSGTSGRYGITTRVYVNPNSNLVPEELKNHIDTAAVNRIRYVEDKEQGLDYIEKQKTKLVEEMFNEVMPRIIKDHGQKGSVYAFHLDARVRRGFNKLKVVFDNNVNTTKVKEAVHS